MVPALSLSMALLVSNLAGSIGFNIKFDPMSSPIVVLQTKTCPDGRLKHAQAPRKIRHRKHRVEIPA